MSETWRSPQPEETRALLARAAVPWWFAGGWAIDLFLGASSRPHSDIDIGCFRADLEGLLAELSGWDIRVAANGRLTTLSPGSSLDSAAHGLWCRPSGSASWVLEILIEDAEGSDWTFRRDRRVRRPAHDIVVHTASGHQVIRPEIQLLYKAKHPRPRDALDFHATWPALNADAQSWLLEHLRVIHPNHPWLAISESGFTPRS